MLDLPQYPRTLHIGTSGGRQSRHSASWGAISQSHVVVEEKLDGSHCGLYFDSDVNLHIFSRNSRVKGNPHFSQISINCMNYMDELWDVLGTRFVLYGKWLALRHTIHYDALPSFFIEDDIFDKEDIRFLDTPSRQSFVENLPVPFSHSAPVLFEGVLESEEHLVSMLGKSAFCNQSTAINSEGFYIKKEASGSVTGRYKWIRPQF